MIHESSSGTVLPTSDKELLKTAKLQDDSGSNRAEVTLEVQSRKLDGHAFSGVSPCVSNLASRKRCSFENAEKCNCYFAPPPPKKKTKCNDSSVIFVFSFLAICLRKLQENLRFEICNLKMQRSFSERDSLGR